MGLLTHENESDFDRVFTGRETRATALAFSLARGSRMPGRRGPRMPGAQNEHLRFAWVIDPRKPRGSGSLQLEQLLRVVAKDLGHDRIAELE